MISSIGSAWKTNLKTGMQPNRDERLYIDFRGKDYPDVSRDVRNYIERGDCESATPPTLRGEVVDSHSNTTAVQSTVQAHSGTNSFLVTKTIAAGTAAYWYPQDSLVTTDMHGHLPGETVEHIAWIYAPSAVVAEISMTIIEYYSAAWHNVATVSGSVGVSWEKLAIRGTLNDAATGFAIQYAFASTASLNEYFYVDDLDHHRGSTFTLAREDNLIDRANCESTTSPMLLDETVPILVQGTFARSTAFKRSGLSSFLMTHTSGTNVQFELNDATSTTDMHGLVAGVAYEFEAWTYQPTGGGMSSGAYAQLSYYDASTSAWVDTVTSTITTEGAFVKASLSVTFAESATGVRLLLIGLDPPGNGGLCYWEDFILRSHSVPGTHKLTGGFTEHLVTLPDTGTIQVKFKPNFAFDTASDQEVYGWISGSAFFRVFYSASNDAFLIAWIDGGMQRFIVSAQYDDGTAHRNINQWITLTVQFDLDTGGVTAGSSLWMNKTNDSTAWNAAIDVKSTVFNKMQIRAYNGTIGDYDIAFVRMFPDYVATDADVQNDFKDVLAEEIYWSMDGHATGKTRCHIPSSPYIAGVSFSKGVSSYQSGAHSSNTFSAQLNNFNGEFSDDQYAAFDPNNAVYNGLVTEKFLQRRCRVTVEDWYDGDFDNTFVGRLTSAGFSRTTQFKNISYVTISARDNVERFHSARFQYGRHWEDAIFSTTVESNSLIHLIARQARPRVKQYLAGNSWEIDADKTDAWTASGGTYTTETNPLFGARCGRLVPGAGAEQIIQVVQFYGAEKLSVGQSFTFYVWILSTAAATGASNYVIIQEADTAGVNAQTSATYTLAGGEGFVVASVTHTITDSDSDRLNISISADAGDTIDFDGAMLIPGDRSLNLFRDSSLTLNDAASSGSVSADKADNLAYDVFGFDCDTVSITHPWKRVEENDKAWTHLQTIADASAVLYIGDDSNGTLRFRAVLADDYSDFVPAYAFDSGDVQPGINTNLTMAQANRIVGRGVYIKKEEHTKFLWSAEGSRAFPTGATGYLSQSVGDGYTWPDDDFYGPFYAKYGPDIPKYKRKEDDESDDTESADVPFWERFLVVGKGDLFDDVIASDG